MYEPFISDSPFSDLWGVQETVVVRRTILLSQLRCYGNWETMGMRFVYVRWWRVVYLRWKQLGAWYWIQCRSLCSACLSAFPVTWRSTGPLSTKLSRYFLQPPANWSYKSDDLQIFVDSKQNLACQVFSSAGPGGRAV